MSVSVLSVTALGVFQIMAFTETKMIKARNELTVRQGEEIALTYIYDDFLDAALVDTTSIQTYDNATISPEELRIVTVFGQQARTSSGSTAAKCQTTALTNETIGTVSFAADCVVTPETAADNKTIAENINAVISTGASVVFAVENSGARCTASTPIDSSRVGYGSTAILQVDDPECLNSPLPSDVPTGSEILFPRFVVYSPENPITYNASLVENVTSQAPGFSLTGPPNIEVRSAINTNISDFILTATAATETGVINIQSNLSGTELTIGDADGATVTNPNSDNITISGTLSQLRRALRNLFYLSADGYFGADNLTVSARSGVAQRQLTVPVNVLPNCGGQTLGTATRFDIGTVDSGGNFDDENATFITSVSVYDASSPTHFFGYCRPNQYRYDYVTQARETHSNNCTASGGITYQLYSSRLMTYDNGTAWNRNRAINIMLYEDSDSTIDDRFALVVVLDAYEGICADGVAPTTLADSRASGRAMTNASFKDLNIDNSIWPNNTISSNDDRRCRVVFQLSNIEPGRNLDNTSDLYTFTDDPNEYTGIIGNDEQLRARASWQSPIDGVVVPLRIDGSSFSPVRLRDYTFGDPIFELIWWDTLDSWNVRALNTSTNSLEFIRYPFEAAPAGSNQAIRLNISQSRACS